MTVSPAESRPAPARLRSVAARLVQSIVLRLLSVVGILLVVSFLTFTLLYFAPGDLVQNLLGNRPSSPEAIADIRAQYRLDDPFFVRYFDWLISAVRGDFGESVRFQQPVSEVIGSRLEVTLMLIGLSFVVAMVVSLPLGVMSAARSGSAVDRTATGLALFGLSAPPFVLGILAIAVFALAIPLFPAYGGGGGGLDSLWHLVLPSAVLAAGIGAIVMRMTRTAVLRELDNDAVTFARSRGVPERTVLAIALRGALIPVVTSAGLVLTFIVGGTIVVETVFALPGLGVLLQESVLFKDVPVVQAITLLIATIIVLVTVIVDFSYLILDPRVRTRKLLS